MNAGTVGQVAPRSEPHGPPQMGCVRIGRTGTKWHPVGRWPGYDFWMPLCSCPGTVSGRFGQSAVVLGARRTCG